MTYQEMEPYIGKEVVIEYKASHLHCELKGKLIHVYLAGENAFFFIKIIRRKIIYKGPMRKKSPRGECILMCKGVEKMTLADQKPGDLYKDFIGDDT